MYNNNNTSLNIVLSIIYSNYGIAYVVYKYVMLEMFDMRVMFGAKIRHLS